MQFRCAEGHQWFTIAGGLAGGKWCPICAPKVAGEKLKSPIEKFQKIAAERGGKCLSEKYVDAKTKLEWQCSKGHIWKSTIININDNCWCPVCGYEKVGDKKRNNIKIYLQLAIEKGGKLLSEKCPDNKTRLLWECKKGHRWYTSAANVKNNKTWCPYCIGKYQTIEQMHEIAAQRGGKCLSEKYINCKTPLLWEYKRGHQWKAEPAVKNNKTWCPQCYNERRCKKEKISSG